MSQSLWLNISLLKRDQSANILSWLPHTGIFQHAGQLIRKYLWSTKAIAQNQYGFNFLGLLNIYYTIHLKFFPHLLQLVEQKTDMVNAKYLKIWIFFKCRWGLKEFFSYKFSCCIINTNWHNQHSVIRFFINKF